MTMAEPNASDANDVDDPQVDTEVIADLDDRTPEVRGGAPDHRDASWSTAHWCG
jgi:hypothetical protein